ncbi:FIG002994: Putative transcriptional regulator [Pseudoalteromonas luteoviolacea B = ATCC 29581]|nr:FIG002994: Putative transcriptional regulator [Pseudoalteromonas luteoviolacea B = ATCC 29581]
MDTKVANFIDKYNQLSSLNLALLEEIYHENVEFQDPLHAISGIEQLKVYFESLYANLQYAKFELQASFVDGDNAFIYWQMTYQHSKLNSGKATSVDGHSHLVFCGDKVVRHRDYLDLGAMLYEQIPVLGWAVKKLKKRAGQ